MANSLSRESKSVVLVTGASSGIGKATAEHLAARGFRVFAGVRRPDAVQLAQNVEIFPLDVTSDASVASAVSEVLRRAGRIDGLVNNAGGSILGAIEETSVAQARALFETNFFGALRVSQAVLPHMREKRSGRIVNVSSVLGFLPAPFMGVYAASKHALEGLSESLDHEVRSLGIRVVLVEPGFTRTNIDSAAARADASLDDYGEMRDRVIANIGAQVAKAPPPAAAAAAIERALRSGKFQRLPVGGEASMLSRLRKWMPFGMFDGAIRKSFSLDGPRAALPSPQGTR